MARAFPSPAAATLRLALGTLLLATLAGAFEVLASQAPGSPARLGILPGPVQLLRENAFTQGFLLSLGSFLLREASAAPGCERLSRRVAIALHVGALLVLGAAVYGALQGMHGVQMRDLRPDATPLFVVKHLGYAVLLVAFVALARRLPLRAI
jgi:hypothetical protein